MDDELQFDPAKASAGYPDGFGQVARPSDRGGARPRTTRHAASMPHRRWRAPADTIAFVNAAQRWRATRPGSASRCCSTRKRCTATWRPRRPSSRRRSRMAGTFDPALVRARRRGDRPRGARARHARSRSRRWSTSPAIRAGAASRRPSARIRILVRRDGRRLGAGPAGRRAARSRPGKVFATLKHMTGHGQPQAATTSARRRSASASCARASSRRSAQVVERTGIARGHAVVQRDRRRPEPCQQLAARRRAARRMGLRRRDRQRLRRRSRSSTTFHHVARRPRRRGAARAARPASTCDLPDGNAYRKLAEEVQAGRSPDGAARPRRARACCGSSSAPGCSSSPYADAAAAARAHRQSPRPARWRSRRRAGRSRC